jgi:methylaspartate mutase sigma subunit
MRRLRCLLTTVYSDSHTWNLVYLQRVMEELGVSVRNLGCCTPVDLVIREIADFAPDLVVLSSVNGHGRSGALQLLSAVRDRGFTVPFVAGGKLTTSESTGERARLELLAAGYREVFVGDSSITEFRALLRAMAASPATSRELVVAGRGPAAEAPVAVERIARCMS